MLIYAVDEFNENGHLVYSSNFIGAYARGKTQKEALQKVPSEIAQYCRWLGIRTEDGECAVSVTEEKRSELQICDADSDVLFKSEIPPLTLEEYKELYCLCMKSAKDFLALYRSVPKKDMPLVPPRKTFYGEIPTTANQMYEHTKNVNDYYFGEIGVPAENEPDIFTCRLRAFERLEQQPDFLSNTVFDGSGGERWSLRKLCRRFVWHDRIHAKAMCRASVKLFGQHSIANPFYFSV